MSTGDYFGCKKDTGLGLTKTSLTNLDSMHRTISFGCEPKKERSLSMVSATSNLNIHKDTNSYIYHQVHLTVPVAEEFRPKTPSDVLEETAGLCLKCASRSTISLNNLDDSDGMPMCEHVQSDISFNGGRSATKKKGLKPILATKARQIDLSRNFLKSVSFDTVNTSYSDGQHYLCSPRSDDEDDEALRTRTRWRSQLERGRQLSPARSLSPTSRDPLTADGNSSLSFSIDGGLEALASKIVKYPTRPIITHDACTLTKKHGSYDDMYAGRLGTTVPKLPNREVMCYISGRKHTWTAIDWCCNQLLENGDSLVIVASIRPQGRSLARLSKKKLDSISGFSTSVRNITENKVRNSPEWAQATTENIMKYCLAVLNPTKIVKITVELSVGSTNEVLTDMFALYQPSIVVTASKPPKNPPTKPWSTKRITDRLVSMLPVPMIIVTSKNMGMFEQKLFEILDERMKFSNAGNNNVVIQREELLRKMDSVGVYELKDQQNYILEQGLRDRHLEKELRDTMLETNDIGLRKKLTEQSSIDDDGDNVVDNNAVIDSEDDLSGEDDDDEISVDSENPPVFQPKKVDINTELKRLELEYQLKVYRRNQIFEDEPLNENSFKDKLCMVMDAAHKYGLELVDAANKGNESNKIVREYIGAPELTRTKSMIISNESAENAQADFNAKMKLWKREAREKSQQDSKKNVKTPKIKINDADKSLSPVSSKPDPVARGQSFSGPYSTEQLQPQISASLSQPEVTKKKKKRFWGLFK